MKNQKTQSVEPNIADLANGWLKSYGLDYKLEQEPLNPQIDKALDEYHSKSGGTGGNRPDAKLLLRDVNLRDLGDAKERYAELVDLVRFGKSKLRIFTEKEYYEGRIDPGNGSDWNQSAPVDMRPTLADFKKTVSDYLAWEVSNLIKKQDSGEEGYDLGKR